MDVLTAAWVGAGSPTPHATSLTGDCSHCGSRDQLVAVRAVVSKQFTGFDGWANPSGRGVCPGCAWGYATAELRAGAHPPTRGVGPPVETGELLGHHRTHRGQVVVGSAVGALPGQGGQ